MLNIDYDDLSQFLIQESSLISVSLNINILIGYNLDLYVFESKRINLQFFKQTDRKPKLIDAISGVLNSNDLNMIRDNYMQVLMDDKTSNLAFIDINNFLITKDKSKILSKDGRILIYDVSGNIPEDALLNVATVALMMLSGNCDQVIGYAYIASIMKVYGSTDFTFSMNGYMHIRVGKDPKMQYRSTVGLVNNNPKAL